MSFASKGGAFNKSANATLNIVVKNLWLKKLILKRLILELPTHKRVYYEAVFEE